MTPQHSPSHILCLFANYAHHKTLYMHLAYLYKLNEQGTQYLSTLFQIKDNPYHANPTLLMHSGFCIQGKPLIPYSGKLSKEKCVANFKCESFLHKFWGHSIRWRHKRAIHESLKIIFSANSPKFSPLKVFHYTVCHAEYSNYITATDNISHSPCTSTRTPHPALPPTLPSTILFCTQLTNKLICVSRQNGTRCDGLNVLWCHLSSWGVLWFHPYMRLFSFRKHSCEFNTYKLTLQKNRSKI